MFAYIFLAVVIVLIASASAYVTIKSEAIEHEEFIARRAMLTNAIARNKSIIRKELKIIQDSARSVRNGEKALAKFTARPRALDKAVQSCREDWAIALNEYRHLIAVNDRHVAELARLA